MMRLMQGFPLRNNCVVYTTSVERIITILEWMLQSRKYNQLILIINYIEFRILGRCIILFSYILSTKSCKTYWIAGYYISPSQHTKYYKLTWKEYKEQEKMIDVFLEIIYIKIGVSNTFNLIYIIFLRNFKRFVSNQVLWMKMKEINISQITILLWNYVMPSIILK